MSRLVTAVVELDSGISGTPRIHAVHLLIRPSTSSLFFFSPFVSSLSSVTALHRAAASSDRVDSPSSTSLCNSQFNLVHVGSECRGAVGRLRFSARAAFISEIITAEISFFTEARVSNFRADTSVSLGPGEGGAESVALEVLYCVL